MTNNTEYPDHIVRPEKYWTNYKVFFNFYKNNETGKLSRIEIEIDGKAKYPRVAIRRKEKSSGM